MRWFTQKREFCYHDPLSPVKHKRRFDVFVMKDIVVLFWTPLTFTIWTKIKLFSLYLLLSSNLKPQSTNVPDMI